MNAPCVKGNMVHDDRTTRLVQVLLRQSVPSVHTTVASALFPGHVLRVLVPLLALSLRAGAWATVRAPARSCYWPKMPFLNPCGRRLHTSRFILRNPMADSLCTDLSAAGKSTLWAHSRGRSSTSDGLNLESMRTLRNSSPGRRAAALEFAVPLQQRALVHTAATRLGLGHASVGVGSLRRVRVFAQDLGDRLDAFENALVAEERAAHIAGGQAVEQHARDVARMREGLRHCRDLPRNGTVARLLDFLLGSGAAAKKGGGEDVACLDEALDDEQRAAVALGMGAEGCRDGAVIHGRPGTGKTRTLVEIVRLRVRCGQVWGGYA